MLVLDTTLIGLTEEMVGLIFLRFCMCMENGRCGRLCTPVYIPGYVVGRKDDDRISTSRVHVVALFTCGYYRGER